MYGWRRRIGLIVPSSNTTMECEIWSVLPEGISLHTTRMPLMDVNVGSLEIMEESSNFRLLIDAGVDCILFGCTSGSLIKGREYNSKKSADVERELGIPFITTSAAVVEALRAVGAKKISVVTPYIDEVNEKEKKFLEEHGFSILSMKGMGIEKNAEIGKVTPQAVYRFAANSKGDCLFISCTNLRTFEIIETLEKDLGIPVITSNQASLWFTLKRLGVNEKIDGLGKLLRL